MPLPVVTLLALDALQLPHHPHSLVDLLVVLAVDLGGLLVETEHVPQVVFFLWPRWAHHFFDVSACQKGYSLLTLRRIRFFRWWICCFASRLANR